MPLHCDIHGRIWAAEAGGSQILQYRFPLHAADSSLNHPHIAAIYGIEQSGATRALVLELVEGETLAERIAKGKTLAKRLKYGYYGHISGAIVAPNGPTDAESR